MDLHQGPVASRSAASRSAPRGAVASASAASGVTPQKSSGSSAEARKKVPPLSSMSLTKPPPELPPQLRTDFEGDPELLGEGAFAVVRRLRHRRTKEIVALKVVEKYPLHIRNMLPQLQREVRIQGNLRHRHILHLHSCLEDDSYVYMLLEHCAGGSLRKLCMSQPNHRLHEAVACRYFAQICQGVDYMHQHLCVHRDLKPENMLLAGDDEVRICDFGWSAEVQMEQALRTTCGTPHCWPPELFEGESQDVGVDLWALGTMCYELVVGHAPFWGDMEELRRKVLAVDLRYPPNVLSKPAINLCHCLMQRDPRSRVSANRLLAEHPWVRQGLSASGACPAPLTPTTLLPAPIAAVGFTSASAAERPAATISAPATRASHLLNAGLGGSAEAAVGPISTPKLAMNPLPTSKSWDFGSVSGLGSAPVEEATLVPRDRWAEAGAALGDSKVAKQAQAQAKAMAAAAAAVKPIGNGCASGVLDFNRKRPGSGGSITVPLVVTNGDPFVSPYVASFEPRLGSNMEAPTPSLAGLRERPAMIPTLAPLLSYGGTGTSSSSSSPPRRALGPLSTTTAAAASAAGAAAAAAGAAAAREATFHVGGLKPQVGSGEGNGAHAIAVPVVSVSDRKSVV